MKLYENPAFAHLDPQFVTHLQSLIDSSTKKRDTLSSLRGMLAINEELTKRQITCTPQMQGALLNAFKETLPKSQRKNFENFVKFFNEA